MTTLLDPIADIRRREFIIGGISMAALLAACGSDADGSPSTDRGLWGGAGVMWANALLDDIDRLFVSR
jgi:hypothetical protein